MEKKEKFNKFYHTAYQRGGKKFTHTHTTFYIIVLNSFKLSLFLFCFSVRKCNFEAFYCPHASFAKKCSMPLFSLRVDARGTISKLFGHETSLLAKGRRVDNRTSTNARYPFYLLVVFQSDCLSLLNHFIKLSSFFLFSSNFYFKTKI